MPPHPKTNVPPRDVSDSEVVAPSDGTDARRKAHAVVDSAHIGSRQTPSRRPTHPHESSTQRCKTNRRSFFRVPTRTCREKCLREWADTRACEKSLAAATVFLHAGFDPVTGRTVAVKTLHFHHKSVPNERRRLIREARVTAQLQHPNTVPVYDIGNDMVNGVFFVMKLISGENLFDILKRITAGDELAIRQNPPSKRVSALADACQALSYAHARGVIHRDVKPENIWLGNFGEVYLLGLGDGQGLGVDGRPNGHSVRRQ